jgi:hypothetical protein
VLGRDSIDLLRLRLPVAQDFAEDDGVGEVAVLKVYIGEELIVEGGEQRLDVRFVEAGALEDDDRAGDRAIGKVMEVDGRDIIPAALGKKSLGRSRVEGAFPGEVHGREVMIQWENANPAGMAVMRTRQPLPR